MLAMNPAAAAPPVPIALMGASDMAMPPAVDLVSAPVFLPAPSSLFRQPARRQREVEKHYESHRDADPDDPPYLFRVQSQPSDPVIGARRSRAPASFGFVRATAAAACPAGAPPRPEAAPRPAAMRPLVVAAAAAERGKETGGRLARRSLGSRSEEHTSELQSPMYV